MPRYFFHLRCEGKDVPDIAGADLRDPDQAWEAARATARDLMETQVDADVNWLTCQRGKPTRLEIPFAECVEGEAKSDGGFNEPSARPGLGSESAFTRGAL